MDPHDEIRSLLEAFQDGYTRRDLKQVDSFMQLFTADAEVIGTNGVRPGMDEWYTCGHCGHACPLQCHVGAATFHRDLHPCSAGIWSL